MGIKDYMGLGLIVMFVLVVGTFAIKYSMLRADYAEYKLKTTALLRAYETNQATLKGNLEGCTLMLEDLQDQVEIFKQKGIELKKGLDDVTAVNAALRGKLNDIISEVHTEGDSKKANDYLNQLFFSGIMLRENNLP